MSARTALKLYADNPHLTNTFSEQFGKGMIAMDKY